MRLKTSPGGAADPMSHTYVSELFHCVFSTKNRCGLIPPSKQPDLWSYLGGIARKNGFKAIAVGGTDNHVHLLLSLPATMPLAKAMQLVKGGSSKWMNDSGASNFAWQEGYGAFSIGISQQADTISYIRSQAEHHHKRGFEEEFLAFLKKHGIEYDPSYVRG
jgi:putative transposase